MKPRSSPPTIAASGLDHPEGLAFGPDGTLWAGGEAGQIYRIRLPKGKVELAANVGGFNLGMAFGPDGALYVCNWGLRAVIRFDPESGTHRVFAQRAGRHRLRVPNALAFGPDRRLYVTDSGDWGKPNGAVLAFDLDGRGAVWADRLSFPNGIAFDPSANSLLVVQTERASVVRYRILERGAAGAAAVVCRGLAHGPDGIVCGEDGSAFVACYSNSVIYRVDARGRKRIIAADQIGRVLNRPTNLAFRPGERAAIYAANLGGWHITRIPLGDRS